MFNVFVESSFKKKGNILVLKCSVSCQAPIHILVWHDSEVWQGNCPPEAIIFDVEQNIWKCQEIRDLLIFWLRGVDPDSFAETWAGSANL